MNPAGPLCVFCLQFNVLTIQHLFKICCAPNVCVCSHCILQNPGFNPNLKCMRCHNTLGKGYDSLKKIAEKQLLKHAKVEPASPKKSKDKKHRRSKSKDKSRRTRQFSNQKELIAHLKKVGLDMVIEHPEEESFSSSSDDDSPIKPKIGHRNASHDCEISRQASLSLSKKGSIRKQF